MRHRRWQAKARARWLAVMVRRMDRSSLLAVVGALAVIVWWAVEGWWLLLAAGALLSLVGGFMAWRAGLPWFRARDDK
jgi:hypothetical protein